MASGPKSSAPGGPIVVIGYGNTLRQDDAVGRVAAEAVAGWNFPGVVSISVHQLTPELAVPLASARLAIFLDARLAIAQESAQVDKIDPFEICSSINHTSDPRWLLALAKMAFGRYPPAWVVSMPALEIGFGESLSSTAERGLQEGLRAVQNMIKAPIRQRDLGGPEPISQRHG